MSIQHLITSVRQKFMTRLKFMAAAANILEQRRVINENIIV